MKWRKRSGTNTYDADWMKQHFLVMLTRQCDGVRPTSKVVGIFTLRERSTVDAFAKQWPNTPQKSSSTTRRIGFILIRSYYFSGPSTSPNRLFLFSTNCDPVASHVKGSWRLHEANGVSDARQTATEKPLPVGLYTSLSFLLMNVFDRFLLGGFCEPFFDSYGPHSDM
jgi:hypothetical protein